MMTDAESEKRFEGAGQEFHAKYMGCVEVAKSKGQEVCQEAMQKLLVSLKARKDPKPRLIINLTYEGTQLKEMPPGINLLEMTFKHSQVSYVWKDPRDQRSLGIVRTEADPADAAKLVHKFHGIRTIKPAMPFLQEMQELFRIVKERSSLQKERSASMAASATENGTAPASQPQPQPEPQTAGADDARNRAVSNLLGPDQSDTPVTGGLPKNASVASLDDLGDIFGASATIGQQPQPIGMMGGHFAQPMAGGQFSQPMGAGSSPFGQPMGASTGPFGQPMGAGGSQFGQPMGAGGSQFGQPMGASAGPFGQPMGASAGPFGQPMGAGGNPFGQPMGAGGSQFGQPMTGAQQYRPQQSQPMNPFGQQQAMPSNPYAAAAPASPYGRPGPAPFSPPPPQQQFYYQQPPQQAARPPPSTNPFDSGFASVFDRQNSVPAGGIPDDLLTPVTLNPVPVTPPSGAAKPDAFSNLVVGLPVVADPNRQQVSGKDLFKPIDKPKASLRDLANQSPRP